MRLNENTKIIGRRVVLVPYEAQHVEKYHKWMQDTELQQLTASEPLTLEQEYEMQMKWREDDDKLTYIVLSKEIFDRTGDQIAAAVGDTNLFLSPQEHKAEAEIMIADPDARGKRFGWEAMLLMMKYAIEQSRDRIWQVDNFEVKIGMANKKSLRMFEAMKFAEIERSTVFAEVTMGRPVTADWLQWLDEQVELQCVNYDSQE